MYINLNKTKSMNIRLSIKQYVILNVTNAGDELITLIVIII